jgi:hypothetical protein
MSAFSSENLPLPISDGITASKESATLQYYRTVSNSTGFQLTVNSTTNQLLPINAYTLTESQLGRITFIDGKKASFVSAGTYIHNIQISVYSSAPLAGICAMDVINSAGVSLKPNFIMSKNITPNIADMMIMSDICDHGPGDTVELRLGGGVLPGGGNLELNILSIIWTIVET